MTDEPIYVISCRLLVDAVMSGNRAPEDVLRACVLCQAPVLVTPYGQAKEAEAKRNANNCYLVCNACALELAKQKKADRGEMQVETSPAAVQAAERSPAAKKRMNDLLRAVSPYD